jgi:hypothetical protein
MIIPLNVQDAQKIYAILFTWSIDSAGKYANMEEIKKRYVKKHDIKEDGA